MQMAVSKGQKAHHTIWQYFTVSNSSDPKKDGAKLQPANFVTTPSVAAALLGQQPTFWGVLY